MKKGSKALALSWGILAVLTALFYLVRPHRSWVDWIIERISAPIRETLGAVTNIVSFSVAEVLYTIIILGSIYLLVKLLRETKRSSRKLKTFALRSAAIALIPAVILTGYNWLWALGYYGSGFGEKSGLAVEGVSAEDLEQVTLYFAKNAVELSTQVARDDEGHFAETGFFEDTEGLYAALETEFPFLRTNSLRPKPMFYSKFMSWIGFTGFYFPFTGEANVNSDFPPALQPETIAHELAHQRRVASEAEANFVGIAAATSSGKTAFEYSGYLSGLTHLGNALYQADKEAWLRIREGLTEEILTDWRDNSAYWAKYESPAETVATAVYDSYLKHNDQELGIQSYGACVDLLVEYYKNKM